MDIIEAFPASAEAAPADDAYGASVARRRLRWRCCFGGACRGGRGSCGMRGDRGRSGRGREKGHAGHVYLHAVSLLENLKNPAPGNYDG